jgi:hypothetical protein
LKHYGHDSAIEFSRMLKKRLVQKANSENNESTSRAIDWFEHDFE